MPVLWPSTCSTHGDGRLSFGLNLATVYGFALIIVALIEALIYDAMCRKKESEFARAEKKKRQGQIKKGKGIIHGNLCLPRFCRFCHWPFAVFGQQSQNIQRVLCGWRQYSLGRERHRFRRGLSLGGLLPGYLRHDRHGWL
jgi:hypothetical protein